MKSIICFGDSNTWGFVPGTCGRYPRDVRWTGILQERVKDQGIRIVEEGLCGRTTVFDDALYEGRKGIDALPFILEGHSSQDAAVIMLGTNDCKTRFHADAAVIGKGISRCIDLLKQSIPAERILLVSPILLGEDVWKPEKDPEFDEVSVDTCRRLKRVCCEIAKIQGTAFLAASDITEASRIDDEHMTAEGHAKLAGAVFEKLLEMKILT